MMKKLNEQKNNKLPSNKNGEELTKFYLRSDGVFEKLTIVSTNEI